MGASEFITTGTGVNAHQAFERAVEDAKYELGHGGYTGSIAEKCDFVKIQNWEDEIEEIKNKLTKLQKTDRYAQRYLENLTTGTTDRHALAHAFADALIFLNDPRITDKWGPAGCLKIDGTTWLFFGLASS